MEIDHLQRVQPPGWALGLVADAPTPRRWQVQGLSVEVREHAPFSLLQIVVPGARALEPTAFRERTRAAYELALETLAGLEAPHAVRWWNFVPGIGRDAGDGLNWYMIFNAGRHAAMQRWFGAEYFDQQLATASAVGSHGDELVVCVLGCQTPGRPQENPRQVPAYNYSEDYGPLPPCFARGTALGGLGEPRMSGALLVGGTASIVGESTMHVGELDRQIDEMLCNLAHLVAAARGRSGPDETGLGCINDARVYVVRPADRERIVNALTHALPGLERMEVLDADLCRSTLLVEVEALTQPGVTAEAASPRAHSQQTPV